VSGAIQNQTTGAMGASCWVVESSAADFSYARGGVNVNINTKQSPLSPKKKLAISLLYKETNLWHYIESPKFAIRR